MSTAAAAAAAFGGTTQKCTACGKTVYPVEELSADGKVYHRACFRCHHCKGTLKFSSYSSYEGVLYCKPHYDQLFRKSGNFGKSFEGTTRSSRVDISNGHDSYYTSKISIVLGGTQEKCVACNKTVYPIEKVTINGNGYHRTCFRCNHGGCILSPSSYSAHEGRLYCKHHHSQLFMAKGDFTRLEEKFPGNGYLAILKLKSKTSSNNGNVGDRHQQGNDIMHEEPKTQREDFNERVEPEGKHVEEKAESRKNRLSVAEEGAWATRKDGYEEDKPQDSKNLRSAKEHRQDFGSTSEDTNRRESTRDNNQRGSRHKEAKAESPAIVNLGNAKDKLEHDNNKHEEPKVEHRYSDRRARFEIESAHGSSSEQGDAKVEQLHSSKLEDAEQVHQAESVHGDVGDKRVDSDNIESAKEDPRDGGGLQAGGNYEVLKDECWTEAANWDIIKNGDEEVGSLQAGINHEGCSKEECKVSTGTEVENRAIMEHGDAEDGSQSGSSGQEDAKEDRQQDHGGGHEDAKDDSQHSFRHGDVKDKGEDEVVEEDDENNDNIGHEVVQEGDCQQHEEEKPGDVEENQGGSKENRDGNEEHEENHKDGENREDSEAMIVEESPSEERASIVEAAEGS